MMFKSDAQRKAVFASLSSPSGNKFSCDNLYSLADLEEGRSIGTKVMVRPTSEYDVIAQDLKQEAKYDTGGADESWRKNMRKKYQMMVALDDAFKQQKDLLQRKYGVEEVSQPVGPEVPAVVEKKPEAKKPEDKFAMRPVLPQAGVSMASMAESQYPGKTIVEGLTGSEIIADAATKEEPFVFVEDRKGDKYVEMPKGETIILAGEGYGYDGKNMPVGEIEKMLLEESQRSGIPVEELKEYVPQAKAQAAASARRFRLREPVYSDKPKTVQMETPIGTLQAKPEFAEEMKTATVKRLPHKDYLKGMKLETFDPTK